MNTEPKAAPVAMTDETAWLVEYDGKMLQGHPGAINWLAIMPKAGGYGAQEMTLVPDAGRALRFARKEDAELMIKLYCPVIANKSNSPWEMYNHLTATEHMWPAALASQAAAQPCPHRIADARNPVVKDGYVCVDCGALFQAADHARPVEKEDFLTRNCLACAMRDEAIGQPPSTEVPAAYLHWLDTKSRSNGVSGNEAWNAGVEWARSQPPAQPVQEPQKLTDAPELPCPFCGGLELYRDGFQTSCMSCGADGPESDAKSYREAILAWNKRAYLTKPVQERAHYPAVPKDAVACIQAYGDARADDDGTSAARLSEAIEELRLWCALKVNAATPSPVVLPLLSDGWLPIETAPQDSRSRLVWQPHSKCVFCASWQEAWNNEDVGSWAVFGSHGRRLYGITHWMPIPDGPALPDESAGVVK